MSNSNTEKTKQLGMPYGTAYNRLRKSLMFKLVQQSGMDTCCKCGEKIETEGELSIEHKTPWMYSSNPVELYFDLDNVAFSHALCNAKAIRRHYNVMTTSVGKSGYKGVAIRTEKKNNKYRAASWQDNQNIHIGYFKTAEEAAEAYDKWAIENLGPEAITNKSLGLLP